MNTNIFYYTISQLQEMLPTKTIQERVQLTPLDFCSTVFLLRKQGNILDFVCSSSKIRKALYGEIPNKCTQNKVRCYVLEKEELEQRIDWDEFKFRYEEKEGKL